MSLSEMILSSFWQDVCDGEGSGYLVHDDD